MADIGLIVVIAVFLLFPYIIAGCVRLIEYLDTRSKNNGNER